AHEIVINSDPCIAYLMEENTMPMQALVIAHACYGHNSFFKGNYLFQTWTDASSIIDYLMFAKHYVRKCEERYGNEEVERVLDACHSLQNYGVDRYRRPRPISAAEEKLRQEEREDQMQR
ncbi:SpoVR family protein, partial [Gilvimarinus sp. 1_MG-2023]|uniref:SpoVR family protein n=1 Tax=Gilvimarinus sp. 1_MG-2023 TaxID=3062638 RepID=UPI0026E19877